MHREPRSLEALRAMSSEQLAQRVKMGDHLELPREVEHIALMPDRSHADAAAGELAGLGFRVVQQREGLKRRRLTAIGESSIEPDTVDAFVDDIHDLITRHSGSYECWTGAILTAKESS